MADQNTLDAWRSRALNDEAALMAALDALEDVVNQACAQSGTLDSSALSAYAHGMRTLAKHGRLVIDSEYGRRVLAHWPTRHDDGALAAEHGVEKP